MIDLYYWTTPNDHKITIFLEETAFPYSIKPVNIGKGEQFAPVSRGLAQQPNSGDHGLRAGRSGTERDDRGGKGYLVRQARRVKA